MKLLSLTNDAVFKNFFTEESKDLLIHFLQAVLELPSGEIKDITILNPEFPKLSIDDRGLIVDLYAKTKSGEIFHVEMQVQNHKFFTERITLYHSRAYSTQLTKGSNFKEIKKTVSVIVTDFVMIEDSPNYHNSFMWKNDEGILLTDVQQIHILELPKIPVEAINDKELWLKLFKAKEESEVDQIVEQSPIMKQAGVRLKELSADEKIREEARVRDDAQWLSWLPTARKTRREAVTVGFDQRFTTVHLGQTRVEND